jgi:hypothetical protein
MFCPLGSAPCVNIGPLSCPHRTPHRVFAFGPCRTLHDRTCAFLDRSSGLFGLPLPRYRCGTVHFRAIIRYLALSSAPTYSIKHEVSLFRDGTFASGMCYCSRCLPRRIFLSLFPSRDVADCTLVSSSCLLFSSAFTTLYPFPTTAVLYR